METIHTGGLCAKFYCVQKCSMSINPLNLIRVLTQSNGELNGDFKKVS